MKPNRILISPRFGLFGVCLASSLGLALLPQDTQAGNPILYTFDTLAVGFPTEGDAVPNTGADSTMVDGTIVGAGSMEIITGETCKLNGVTYGLGNTMLLNSGTPNSGVATGFLPSQVGIRGNTDYTAMAWMNVLDQSGDHMIFSGTGSGRLHLGTRNAAYHSGHWGDDASGGTTQPGVWHHVAYTNEAATGKQTIYVDGVPVTGDNSGTNGNPNDSSLLIASSDAFLGMLDEVRVYDQLFDAAMIQDKAVEGLTAIPQPGLTGATFTDYTEVTITLEDFSTTEGVVDPTSVDMDVNGVAPDPSEFTVNKVDTTTTIVYTFPPTSPPAAAGTNTFYVFGDTVDMVAFADTIAAQSPALPEVIRAGVTPPAPTDTWDLIEIKSPTAFDGNGQVGYGQAIALLAAEPITEQEAAPVINHDDPYDPGGGGRFKPDLPIPSAATVGGSQNDLVIYGRMNLTVPAAGKYTFHVEGDDGYALRIEGATATGIAGGGANLIDSFDPSTACFPGWTGNSNGTIVYDFPTGPTYPTTFPVEFVGLERGGGFYQELTWVPGEFTAVNQTVDWELVGDHVAVEDTFESPWTVPAGIIPDITSEGGWASQLWYDAVMWDDGAGDYTNRIGNLNELTQFLALVDEGNIDAEWADDWGGSLSVLNHHNNGYFNPDEGDYPGNPSSQYIAMVARARIIIPADGDYTFQIQTDDGFLFRLLEPGDEFKSFSGGGEITLSTKKEIFFDGGTGGSDTRGVVYMTAGEHEVLFLWWDGGGGNHFEVSSAPGAHDTFSAADFTVIGAPVEPTVIGVGVTAPGWEVTRIGPELDPPIQDGPDSTTALAGTFAYSVDPRIAVSTMTSTHEEIALYDPDNGGGIPQSYHLAWPGDVVGTDDNNYAMIGTAILDIQTAGDYYLGWDADDAAYLQVTGQTWTSIEENLTGLGVLDEGTPGSGTFDRLIAETPSGNSRCIGLINLPVGQHPVEFGYYELTGGSAVTIIGAPANGYGPGATLFPLGVNRGGQTYVPPVPLALAAATVPGGFEITDIRHLGATVELDIEGLDSAQTYKVYRDTVLPLGASKVQVGADVTGETSTMVTDGGPLPVDAYYQVEQQ